MINDMSEMPTWDDFEAAFDRECPDGYRVRLGFSDSRAADGTSFGDGTYNASDLYEAVRELIEKQADADMAGEPYSDNGPGSLAWSILYTLQMVSD